VLNAAYNGAFAADIESDGDLDIVLAPRAGAPVVARNNGDGTFAIVRPFAGAMNGLEHFALADIDGDGDPDAALIEPQNGQGVLRVYTNERSGQYFARSEPVPVTAGFPLTVADLNRDGCLTS
jgi:hypothetical protein